MKYPLLRNLIGVVILLICKQGLAHEDMDIAIQSLTFNDQCKAQITLENIGRPLPESFYQTVNPVYVTIKKGSKEEQLASLRQLDKKRSLQDVGGRLLIQSKKSYANIPHHALVELHPLGEFYDYGLYNNAFRKSLDCEKGKGNMAGAPIVYEHPDVAFKQVSIDENCILNATLENLTQVALPETAWLPNEGGVEIRAFNLDTGEPLFSLPFVSIDAKRGFTKDYQQLAWQYTVRNMGALRIKVAVWYVPDDMYFPNNEYQINIPEACQGDI